MPKRLLRIVEKFDQFIPDNKGKPFVYETDEERSLQFNLSAVQSTMRLDDPYELELGYTRAMMGFLLFNPSPRSILMVGLGGGSLQKYCYRNLTDARITTLEINEEVIALRDKFLIPADGKRFSIVRTDAVEYLAGACHRTDVILLDGFNAEGLPAGLSSASFYADCKRALHRRGVLAANLSGSIATLEACLERLHDVFSDQVWYTKVEHDSNLIAFAVKDKCYYPHRPKLMATAYRLRKRLGLNLPWIAENMRQRPGVEQSR